MKSSGKSDLLSLSLNRDMKNCHQKHSSLALIMTISRCHQGTKNGSSRYTAIEACSKTVISCMKYQDRVRFLNNTRTRMERERETGGDESERTRDVSKCCAISSSVVINEEEGLLLGEIKKTDSHAPEAS